MSYPVDAETKNVIAELHVRFPAKVWEARWHEVHGVCIYWRWKAGRAWHLGFTSVAEGREVVERCGLVAPVLGI